MWISKQEYEEGGKGCVDKKCPWRLAYLLTDLLYLWTVPYEPFQKDDNDDDDNDDDDDDDDDVPVSHKYHLSFNNVVQWLIQGVRWIQNFR